MQRYEYKVVPAPNRSKKVRGVKTPAGRYAVVLTETINEEAADGWEFLRSDSLPVEEKPGLLKSRVENYYTMLVFRRALEGASTRPDAADEQRADLRAPAIAATPPGDSRDEPRLGHAAGRDDREGRAEPGLSRQSDDGSFPADPPIRAKAEPRDYADPGDGAEEDAEPGDDAGKQDDSPFAEPQDKDDQIVR